MVSLTHFPSDPSWWFHSVTDNSTRVWLKSAVSHRSCSCEVTHSSLCYKLTSSLWSPHLLAHSDKLRHSAFSLWLRGWGYCETGCVNLTRGQSQFILWGTEMTARFCHPQPHLGSTFIYFFLHLWNTVQVIEIIKVQFLMITVPLRYKLNEVCMFVCLCITYNIAILIFQIYSKPQTFIQIITWINPLYKEHLFNFWFKIHMFTFCRH